MATALGGYGSVIRVTGSINLSGAAVARGEAVTLIGTGVRTDGIGDEWLLVELEAAAGHLGTLGIAAQDMAAGTAAEYGGTGHVIVYGYTKVMAGETIAANTALAVETVTGRLMKATAVQVDASIGVGITLEAGADGGLISAFVNFINRADVGSAGYAGLET